MTHSRRLKSRADRGSISSRLPPGSAPVCRIIISASGSYEPKKKAKEAKSKQTFITVKR